MGDFLLSFQVGREATTRQMRFRKSANLNPETADLTVGRACLPFHPPRGKGAGCGAEEKGKEGRGRPVT